MTRLSATILIAATVPAAIVGLLAFAMAVAGVQRGQAVAWLPSAIVGVTVIVLLVAAAVVAIVVPAVQRPLAAVASGLRRVAEGDLADAPVSPATGEIGELVAAHNSLVEALRQQHAADEDSARGGLLEKLIEAQEEERKRIARELHDGVGQALLSMVVGLKLIGRLEDLDAAQAKADDVREVAAETLEQVRLLSRELRPSVLDDLGLAVALERYGAEFPGRYPGIAVDVHCDVTDRLPSVIETALYRIVQEAMTNAARHSGGTTISVLLLRRDNRVQAIIEDNGSGFDVPAVRRERTSVGIHGMAERAELIGGTLELESGEEGTTVYVEVPL